MALVEPRVLELESVLDESRNLSRRLIGEDVCLAVISSPGLSRVSVDPSQINQVADGSRFHSVCRERTKTSFPASQVVTVPGEARR